MIRSMTGYGEAERAVPAGRLRVEVRTVNHRYFHATFRLPAALSRWEGEMREWLRASIARGHASCTVRVDREGTAQGSIRIDEERVAAYIAAFRELTDRFAVTGAPTLELLARYGDIFVRDGAAEEPALVLSQPYTLFNAFLQIRVIVVRAFLLVENVFNLRGAADIPGREFPGARAIYGIRWYFRN